ncbi:MULTISPECIES: FAD-dependent monooxygenase [Paraburkholderia]|uniref:FAD-dependent monooxygenase n=1 Tax=Paraburkholderia TaxID=1822464 RepID=UPI00224D0F67|nr:MULTISPECIES: FAD-dependent monooxygenase [Paraburkholderia]MCX4163621.1 FAD-dependent monooxygenase [Paraburkholderia megapolitana]MDN7159116.1 FAD-dependent monooxygenase [Paraburkholderia sp. CHISQ3]MDQ6496163.1 FAD-dependent monooxygenase [Paraburkholderia megapolitana]
MTKIKSVLIVGGGIGGLTSAIALRQRGIDAVVVEQNPHWSVYGVGIIQPSNMLRALKTLGLGDACLAAGVGFHGWKFCDANGQVLGRAASLNVAGPGYPAVNGIGRPALHKILTDAVLAQGTQVRLGVTVAATVEKDHGIEVVLSDGTSGMYDLMIGADGAYSKTRSRLFGDRVRPDFTGEAVWRYNFPRPKDLDWAAIYYGKNSKAGLVPLTASSMYLFLASPEPGNPRMPAERLHDLLRDRLSEYGGIVGKLREQITDPAAVVYRPMEVVMLPAPWHVGRTLLIGDAAHSGTPHLAEGAAMAIEDSVVLAEILADTVDLDAALAAFAERREPRTRLVYETGLKLGEWEQAEWARTPVPDANHQALFERAYATLAEPI